MFKIVEEVLIKHAEEGAFPGLNIKEGGYAELLKTSVRNLIKLPTVLAPKDVAPFQMLD